MRHLADNLGSYYQCLNLEIINHYMYNMWERPNTTPDNLVMMTRRRNSIPLEGFPVLYVHIHTFRAQIWIMFATFLTLRLGSSIESVRRNK